MRVNSEMALAEVKSEMRKIGMGLVILIVFGAVAYWMGDTNITVSVNGENVSPPLAFLGGGLGLIVACGMALIAIVVFALFVAGIGLALLGAFIAIGVMVMMMFLPAFTPVMAAIVVIGLITLFFWKRHRNSLDV